MMFQEYENLKTQDFLSLVRPEELKDLDKNILILVNYFYRMDACERLGMS